MTVPVPIVLLFPVLIAQVVLGLCVVDVLRRFIHATQIPRAPQTLLAHHALICSYVPFHVLNIGFRLENSRSESI